MTQVKAVSIAVMLLSTILTAQEAKPTFEVASVKKLAEPYQGFPQRIAERGSFSIPATPVAYLIQFAYDVRGDLIVGGPDWVRTQIFEVNAKTANEASADEMRPMMQVAHSTFAQGRGVIAQASLGVQEHSGVKFEVASVKPDARERAATEPPGIYLRMLPGGRLDANTTLHRLIVYAFDLRPYQRVRGFEQLLDQRFSIMARVAAGVTVAEKDERPLVRALLADRFSLRARFEERAERVWALRRVDAQRLGPGLRPSNLDCSVEVNADRNLDRANPFRRCSRDFFSIEGRLALVAPSMTAFADHLSRTQGRVVSDETGLKGPWEIDTTFSPVPSFPGVPAEAFSKWPTLETALRNDLGLRLDTSRGVVSDLVIDHVTLPSAN